MKKRAAANLASSPSQPVAVQPWSARASQQPSMGARFRDVTHEVSSLPPNAQIRDVTHEVSAARTGTTLRDVTPPRITPIDIDTWFGTAERAWEEHMRESTYPRWRDWETPPIGGGIPPRPEPCPPGRQGMLWFSLTAWQRDCVNAAIDDANFAYPPPTPIRSGETGTVGMQYDRNWLPYFWEAVVSCWPDVEPWKLWPLVFATADYYDAEIMWASRHVGTTTERLPRWGARHVNESDLIPVQYCVEPSSLTGEQYHVFRDVPAPERRW